MSGLLSGLLTAVAVVATVATGGALGIVAGALIAASYASSKGWIGGSIGKFFNSSTGKDLTMAVGLASAATSIMGYANAVTPATAAAATSSGAADVDAATSGAIEAAGSQSVAGTAAAAAAAAPTGAGGAADLAAGNAAIQAGNNTLAAATPSGTMAMTSTGANQFISGMQGADPSITSPSGLQATEIQAAQTAADQAATTSGVAGTASNVPTGEVADANQALGITNLNQTSGAELNNAQAATAGKGVDTVSANAGQDLTPVDYSASVQQAKVNAADAANQQADLNAAPTAKQSMLGAAGAYIKNNPAVAVMGGQALSGLAQGMAQQKMTQEQIAAQQWGNMQWEQPNQVANLQAAAAAPISVPVGYLNRAAAVRNLMNGSTNQQTSLTGGTPAGVPSAASAPTPTVAPVGMASNGPVPVLQMNSTPRGGMA